MLLTLVVDGVPRCTEVTFKRTEGGREVRDKDLRAISKDEGLDTWVEAFVAVCSGEIVERGPDEVAAALAASDRKATTKTMYAGMARKHIAGSRLGALPLDKLKPMHVEAWIVGLRAKGLSESTCGRPTRSCGRSSIRRSATTHSGGTRRRPWHDRR